jgi:hypothetical protein
MEITGVDFVAVPSTDRRRARALVGDPGNGLVLHPRDEPREQETAS